MYGMMHRAIEGLITERFGEAKWQSTLTKSGVGDVFVANQSYDDAVTMQLIQSATEVLEISQVSLLESLGHYWVKFVSSNGYRSLLVTNGDSLERFLSSLNEMHDRVARDLPELNAPKFYVERVDDDTLRLEYRSPRLEFRPMVFGALAAIEEFFGTELQVQLELPRNERRPFDSFLITVTQHNFA